METGKIKRGEEEAKNIAKRLKNKDFSGNTGQAIKNSTWQIATSLTAKIGSLLFTIILARLLMPELYGLYGLALSTILLIGSFSDLGLSSTVVPFLSKTIDKNKAKAKAFFEQLTKYKIILVLATSLITIISASWISNIYYQKPIFLALLAGAIYLPAVTFSTWFEGIFQSKNQFRPSFVKEVIFQVLRLVILPLVILVAMKNTQNNSLILLTIILVLSLTYLLAGLFLFVKAKRQHPFNRTKSKKLNSGEKKKLNKFIIPLTVTALSGVFFGYIDTIMLGHFVDSNYIAYYQTAFNLIASAAVIIGFAGASMLPIFSRLKSSKLDKAFKEGRLITFFISVLALLLTISIPQLIISVTYGASYSAAAIYLQIFSILLVGLPLATLYQSYYLSQKRTKVISIALIISTILNITLNYIFIKYGLLFGMSQAVIGACLATIISRFFYLFALMIFKKKK